MIRQPARARVRRLAIASALVALILPFAPRVVSLVQAQLPGPGQMQFQGAPPDDGRFAGLQWTFVRVKYNSVVMGRNGRYRVSEWDEPWAIDGPAAEQNLARRVRSVTSIDVRDPIVVPIEDEQIWQYPWIYMVEPSNLVLSEADAKMLREFLLRGGTLTLDDFHGPYEWDLVVRQLKLVFPDREVVELEPPHPLYTCFYKLDKYPQIPGLGSFFQGRTWEKGGFVPHLRAILDDAGRPMVLINWNTDMGDGVEWSNAEDYPGYLKFTAMAYQMFINEIIYSLTH